MFNKATKMLKAVVGELFLPHTLQRPEIYKHFVSKSFLEKETLNVLVFLICVFYTASPHSQSQNKAGTIFLELDW